MSIKMFDVVELTDGRIGTVIEIFTEPREAFMIELQGCEDMDYDEATPIVALEQIRSRKNNNKRAA